MSKLCCCTFNALQEFAPRALRVFLEVDHRVVHGLVTYLEENTTIILITSII